MKSLVATLLFCSLALALASNHWTLVQDNEIHDLHEMKFKVALKPQNVETLDRLFWQVSDPESPLYGHFLTNEQIADLISLPEEDIQTVEDYLMKDNGQVCNVFVERSIHKDILNVYTCAGQAKLMFPNLQLAVYQNQSQRKVLRSAALTDIAHNLQLLGVPTDIHQYIAAIHEVTDVPMPIFHVGSNVNTTIPWSKSDRELTIKGMMDLFKVNYDGIDSSSMKVDDAQVRQAVVEMDRAWFSAKDLAMFQKEYSVAQNPIRKMLGVTEEESTWISADYEATLDIQTITSIAGTVETWDIVFTGDVSFLHIAETLLKTEGLPKVISQSWIGYEDDMTESQVTATSIGYMKLGLTGVSYFIPSGDTGPNMSASCNSYDPQYPPTCPYITAVGGMKVNDDTNVQGAWMHGSGGFSKLVKRPSFQEEKVSNYLNSVPLPPNPKGAVYTTAGRAYPDVSAIAALEPMIFDGKTMPIGGTSGASPQFAAFAALINVHRYQKGLGPIGPVTQTFWKIPSIGTDIVEGQSYATNRVGQCGTEHLPGYKAAKGWDPVTGVGSPDFQLLLDYFLSLPGEKRI